MESAESDIVVVEMVDMVVDMQAVNDSGNLDGKERGAGTASSTGKLDRWSDDDGEKSMEEVHRRHTMWVPALTEESL
jgi:hypothetical protein